MDKVWFKLRQTDYPPPDTESMGTSTETAPLCLGHFIPSLHQIDFPINRHEIEPFPPSMPVYTTGASNFQWEDTQVSEKGSVFGGGAPVLATVGAPITPKAEIGAVFKASVSSYESYDRLDTYLVQVNPLYIDDCLEGEKISRYINKSKLGTWSMFIVTGMKVARAGSRSTSSSRKVEQSVGIGAELPVIASIDAGTSSSREGEVSIRAAQQSDFVWAIRLAKVHKGFLRKDWTVGPHTNKATFDETDGHIDLIKAISNESEERFGVFEDDQLGETLIVWNDGERNASNQLLH